MITIKPFTLLLDANPGSNPKQQKSFHLNDIFSSSYRTLVVLLNEGRLYNLYPLKQVRRPPISLINQTKFTLFK